MMRVRLTHIDGKLPNMALMTLSAHHRDRGDEVHFTKDLTRGLFEPEYDRVYGSAVFAFSRNRLASFMREFPEAVVGGTGSGRTVTVEDVVGEVDRLDYSIYPNFPHSIGFTQRGCRLRCKFCVVPTKEGRVRSASTIAGIWRGDPYPRNLVLLDNDFFGNPEWRDRHREIVDGGFRVSLNQGINVRLIDDEAAAALASMEYRDGNFTTRRVYTAWDNLKDEGIFFRGIDRLEGAGIPPSHVMAYMLVGYARDETMDRVMYRFDRMVERGILPYPMVYDRSDRLLRAFQRWAVTGLYRSIPFSEYDVNARPRSKGEGNLL